jgi:hypothetical protein
MIAEADFDPLVNIAVTVTVRSIRALDALDLLSNPNFFVDILINDVSFTSPIWPNASAVYGFNWSATLNVPDDVENVTVTIQLWDQGLLGARLCDISGEPNIVSRGYSADMVYNIKTGQWCGDDFRMDPSGYGRLNGCDDGSIAEQDRDCELWFDVSQNDFDGDGIPYWTEVYAYGTDPTVNNLGEDADHDGLPIEWEHHWGYNPNLWDDHTNLDPDHDGLTNKEEFLTSEWGSDPFRRDLFLEVDHMATGPSGVDCSVPTGSVERLKTVYAAHNIVFHYDNGSMGGGEVIPFSPLVRMRDVHQLYVMYFLHSVRRTGGVACSGTRFW